MIRILSGHTRSAWALLSLFFLCLSASGAQGAAIVLVVDDLGYHRDRGAQIVALPGPVTLALLPHAPHSAYLAHLATDHGKDVILHQPMQPTSNRLSPAGALTAHMTPSDFSATLRGNLAALPHIKGVNNHTGSLLTQQEDSMDQLMLELKREGLFFLDSRTTPHTVAATAAQRWDVPVLSRDVFLDNSRDPTAIDAQFRRALGIARKDGLAVIIAHPYPESIAYLNGALAALPADIELQSLSVAMSLRSASIDPFIDAASGSESADAAVARAAPTPAYRAAPAPPESPGYPRRSLGL